MLFGSSTGFEGFGIETTGALLQTFGVFGWYKQEERKSRSQDFRVKSKWSCHVDLDGLVVILKPNASIVQFSSTANISTNKINFFSGNCYEVRGEKLDKGSKNGVLQFAYFSKKIEKQKCFNHITVVLKQTQYDEKRFKNLLVIQDQFFSSSKPRLHVNTQRKKFLR